MKLSSLLACTALVASPVFAEETRQLDSHEHGVGQLNIAFDGSQLAMELHAPGADIVGFEYGAESDEDVAAVEAALLVLAEPLELFVMPDAAQCSVIKANVDLEGGDEHDEHGHEDEHEDEHDDHDHDEEDHDAHGHDEHEEEAGHTEFHGEYLLECGDVTALSEVSFAYFDAFPNALEVEVQVLSDSGATAFEVERDAPMLDLSGLN